jgi:hypothetical protein
MRRQQSQRHSDEMDEHDQPTEPMPAVPQVGGAYGVAGSDGADIPIPQPYERPFPYQDVPYSAPASPSAAGQQPVYQLYPLTPPDPSYGYGERPPRGVVPGYPAAAGWDARRARARTRPSSIPVLVGLFFVLVQLLLLARFILILLALPASTSWAGIIYALSSTFVLPFRLLQQNFTPPLPVFPGSIELFTLLAILIYGLLSRILVRFLKALLR